MNPYAELSAFILCLLAALSLFSILLGGELLVRAALFLAHAWGKSSTLIALSVVALATSLPELVVSTTAASKGNTALALGNLSGSNLANFGLILGFFALLRPLKAQRHLLTFGLPLAAAALVLLVLLSVPAHFLQDSRYLTRYAGAGLCLFLLVSYLAYLAYSRRAGEAPPPAPPLDKCPKSVWPSAFLACLDLLCVLRAGEAPPPAPPLDKCPKSVWSSAFLACLALLCVLLVLTHSLGLLPIPWKSYLIIPAALAFWLCKQHSVAFILLALLCFAYPPAVLVSVTVELATRWGLAADFLALTLLAIGTSLPEIATSCSAFSKREDGIIVGNLVGSNILNTLFIGSVAVFFPLKSTPPLSLSSLLAACVALPLAFFFLKKDGRVGRYLGAYALSLYLLALVGAYYFSR